MTKRIRPSEPVLEKVRDSGAASRRVEPDKVAASLGAEASATQLEEVFAPITLFALREELVNRLQSSGGRPGLSGTTRRAKIPLCDKEWLELEELAAAISAPGFAPSAGQVASVLLSLSVQTVASQVSGSPAKATHSPLVRELAARAALEARRAPKTVVDH